MRRIVHVSDLHFPPRSDAQALALAEAVHAQAPDLVVVSGDLTRRGSRREFELAARFLVGLPKPQLVIPGNHDVPHLHMPARVTRPFRRYREALAEDLAPLHVDEEVAVAGLNTSRGVQLRLDWSLGRIGRRTVRRAIERLAAVPADRVRIAVTHHPLSPDVTDPGRSRVRGAHRALAALTQAGISIMLHGHLHRPRVDMVTVEGRAVVMVGAATALSDRERGGGSGFNVLEVEGDQMTVAEARWDGSTHATEPPRTVRIG